MRYEIINSGSDGNAILINNYFLLDCGVSYKKIKKYLNKLKLIFISHVLSSLRSLKQENNKTNSI